MGINRNDWASIPSGYQMKLDELDQHPYWGEDFAAGESGYCLVQRESGGYIAVISWGGWDGFIGRDKIAVGDWITFFHTQTFAKTHAKVIGFINKDTDVSQFGITRKVPTWTLK